jgi:predicted phosphodiesterase
MAGITWLHLSDWHQGSEAFVKYEKSEAFDRELLGKRLKQDILNRTNISNDLAKIDFFVFSGDVAFSGQATEYQAAVEQLFTPVLEAAGLGKDRIFIIPGNHDLDRRKFQYLSAALTQPFSFDAEVNQWLAKKSDRKYVLIPFEAYDEFIHSYNGQDHPTFASVMHLEIEGEKVALLGLNSALMCGRNKILKNGKEEVDDYGKLVVGEPQLEDGLDRIEEADVCIAVLHHPFEWLMHNERSRTEEQLGEKFHFILCGHEHFPKVNKIEGTSGDCFIIPAGAGFDRRIPEDPSYTNAYNFVHLNFDNGQFTVYLRRWNNRNRVWDKDTSKYPNGQVSFILPKLLGHPMPKEETPASPLPGTPAVTIPGSFKGETPASPLPSTPAAKIPGSFTDSANKVVLIILTYQERSDLTDALLRVFPNQEDFEMMFERNFERKLNTLVDGTNYRTRVYRLIEWTEAEGRTYNLIRSAHEGRPLNPALQSWLQRYETEAVKPEAQQVTSISPGFVEPPRDNQPTIPEQERQKPNVSPEPDAQDTQKSMQALPNEEVLEQARKPQVIQMPYKKSNHAFIQTEPPGIDRVKLLALLSNCPSGVFSTIVSDFQVPAETFSKEISSQAEKAAILIERAEQSGEDGLPALYIVYFREILERTRNVYFEREGPTYKDQCDQAIENVKNLNELVQKLLKHYDTHGYLFTVPLNDIANQGRDLRGSLDAFRNRCPPPPQNAAVKDYYVKREGIHDKMKTLLTALDELLSRFK